MFLFAFAMVLGRSWRSRSYELILIKVKLGYNVKKANRVTLPLGIKGFPLHSIAETYFHGYFDGSGHLLWLVHLQKCKLKYSTFFLHFVYEDKLTLALIKIINLIMKLFLCQPTSSLLPLLPCQGQRPHGTLGKILNALPLPGFWAPNTPVAAQYNTHTLSSSPTATPTESLPEKEM